MCTGYLSEEATSFALQTGKVMGCTSDSSATESRAVGWATELSVYSGKVPWSGELKALFSSEWGYEFVPLPKLI